MDAKLQVFQQSEAFQRLQGMGGATPSAPQPSAPQRPLFLTYEEIMGAPDPAALVAHEGEAVLWANGVNVIAAPVKTGKTSFISLLLYGGDERRRVLWCDGEQPLADIKRTYKTLQSYAHTGREIEGLKFVQLITIPREDRLDHVKDAIREHKPEVIVIDGLQQLMKVRDEENAAAEVIDSITTESDAIGATVIVSIQISRTSTNVGMPSIKGHIGSMAQERAVQILYLRHEEATGETVVESKGTRRGATMAPIYLERGSDGLFKFVDSSRPDFMRPTPKIDPNVWRALKDISKANEGHITSKFVQSYLNYTRDKARHFLGGLSDTEYQKDSSRPLRSHGTGRNTYYTIKEEDEERLNALEEFENEPE